MACFLVSAAEAAVVTVAAKFVQRREEAAAHKVCNTNEVSTKRSRIPFSRKLKWLANLQWGGSVLLAFEHLWHGEIVPWAPFLTAMYTNGDTASMLQEMATVGVGMAVLTTAVWGVMLLGASYIEKKAEASVEAELN